MGVESGVSEGEWKESPTFSELAHTLIHCCWATLRFHCTLLLVNPQETHCCEKWVQLRLSNNSKKHCCKTLLEGPDVTAAVDG